MMNDYSQGGEQAVILANCGSVGTFLNIGANDGVTFSNTRALVELGWSGIYVEPGEAAAKKLKKNLPGAYVFQVAISDQDGEAEFHESDEASQHMLSTLINAETRRWSSFKFATRTVKTITVKTLLERALIHGIDFLSIDTEGSDLMIFRQFDLSGLGIRLVCVEHNGKNLTDFDAHAHSHGMKRIFSNETNVIYALQ
jgi:FkbM family methyltransferase